MKAFSSLRAASNYGWLGRYVLEIYKRLMENKILHCRRNLLFPVQLLSNTEEQT